jgi:hypothetical protein
LLSLAVSSAYADFQWQVDALLGSSTTDYEDTNEKDLEVSTTALDGYWFFTSVSTDAVPIREAAFLRRNSFIQVGLNQSDFEQKPYKDDSLDSNFVRADVHIADM